MIISRHADHRRTDYRFERTRQDRLYVPLERSRPIRIVRGDIIATVVVVICGPLAFVVAKFIVDVFNAAGKAM